jgi:hypothetical protein
LRRVIFAFATRTASVLVGGCFGFDAFATFPIVRIIICVGMIEMRWIGCVRIGPIVGLFLGMEDNSFPPISFIAADL